MAFAEMKQFVKLALDAARGRFPERPPVHGLIFEIGVDSTGDDAVWIWAILDDSVKKADLDYEKLEPVADIIRMAIRGEFTDQALDLIPYVSFRTKSEQQEIEAGTI